MKSRFSKIVLLSFISFLIAFFLVKNCSAQGLWPADILQKMQEGSITTDDIATMIELVISFVLSFVELIAIAFIIIGGYQYMTSAGNPERVQRAKATLTYAITGVIVAGLSNSIIQFIINQNYGSKTDIQDLIITIISNILWFFVGLAVLFLVVGGYQYITSTGNPDSIQKAKNTIKGSIAGIIIVLLSRAIVIFVQNQIKGNPPLQGVLESFIKVAIGTASTVALLFIIIGGYQYITSTGNPDSIQKAKNTLLYSIIGLGIAILSYAIFRFVVNIFGAGF